MVRSAGKQSLPFKILIRNDKPRQKQKLSRLQLAEKWTVSYPLVEDDCVVIPQAASNERFWRYYPQNQGNRFEWGWEWGNTVSGKIWKAYTQWQPMAFLDTTNTSWLQWSISALWRLVIQMLRARCWRYNSTSPPLSASSPPPFTRQHTVTHGEFVCSLISLFPGMEWHKLCSSLCLFNLTSKWPWGHWTPFSNWPFVISPLKRVREEQVARDWKKEMQGENRFAHVVDLFKNLVDRWKLSTPTLLIHVLLPLFEP